MPVVPQVQRCCSCSTLRFPAREVCHQCLGSEVEWQALATVGRVVSYIVVHATSIEGHAVPFCVVHVELDDGIRMTGKWQAAAPSVGQRVRMETETAGAAASVRFVADA